MGWFVYDLPPIDFGWHMLPTAKEFLQRLIDATDDTFLSREPNCGVEGFLSALNHALDVAGYTGGDGELRGEPRVMVVPGEAEHFVYGFVIKMDRSGTTYVVSPVEMPWLGGAR